MATTGREFFTGADAPTEVLDLVARLMPLLLAGDHPTCRTLRKQYASATIREVELNAVGFVVYFDISADAPQTEPKKNYTGGEVTIRLEGIEQGAGCLLLVRDGVIIILEVYIYAPETWPERLVVLGLDNVSPLITEKAG